jgi:putative ABC transport system permease protein
VLLVACVNLASANLARGETRRREYAVRTALGAGRGRIVRQVLTENLLLAVVGGAVGSVVAWGLTRGLVALGTGTLPRYAEVYVDGRVLAFAAAASLLTGIVVGLAPAWQVTRDLRGAISAGGRAGIEGGRLRARGLLIGAEVALAVALLTGAGLLVKSLNTLLGEDIGIHTDGVLAADLSLPDTYRDTARVTAFFDLALPAVRAIPGVTSAGLISSLPIVGSGGNSMFAIDGGTDLPGSTNYRVVDSAYFRTLGIPLTMGRGFSADDRSGAPHVVVINRAMANKFWPGISPLGHRIRFPGMDRHPSLWLTIVGVVADVRGDALDAPASPESFISSAQRPETLARMATLVVRSSLPAGQVATAVAQRVHALDANVLVRSAPLTARIGQSVAPRRFSTVVLSTFAALALALAAIGIYGVLAYVVAQRQREIGVRMALGAERRTVRGMVLLDAMRAVLPGLVVGLVGAFALTRFLRGLLYGVQPTDPTVFAIVALVLTAVALLASWIPARRATRVDPLIAMRAD